MQGRSIKTASDTDILATCDTVPDMLARYDAVQSNAEEIQDWYEAMQDRAGKTEPQTDKLS